MMKAHLANQQGSAWYAGKVRRVVLLGSPGAKNILPSTRSPYAPSSRPLWSGRGPFYEIFVVFTALFSPFVQTCGNLQVSFEKIAVFVRPVATYENCRLIFLKKE